MKYRYLTYKELELMKEDFSKFLYNKGFNRFEWNVLQDQNSDEAVDLLGKFSDETFDKVMQSVEYLEHRSPKRLVSYHCTQNEMTLIGIEAPEESLIDFTDSNTIDVIKASSSGAYKCFKEVRSYQGNRENLVFDMIESGYFVVDSNNFEYLEGLRSVYQN